MKTSLNINNRLFKAAQREAHKNNKTISELIGYWALVGYESLFKQKKRRCTLKSVDLGGEAALDLNSRRHWMDAIDQ